MGPAGPWIVATHSIPWPSGGTIKISAVTAPRSQVNLQECFALKAHPRSAKADSRWNCSSARLMSIARLPPPTEMTEIRSCLIFYSPCFPAGSGSPSTQEEWIERSNRNRAFENSATTKLLQLQLQWLPIGAVFESFLTLLGFQRQGECRDIIRNSVLD